MDLISRQAVLNLKQIFTDNAGYETEYVDVEDIKELPSIPSVDNKGEWIYSERFSKVFPMYVCSKCSGLSASCYVKFCPNCGADMRGDKE